MREVGLKCSQLCSSNDAFFDLQHSSVLTKYTREFGHNSYHDHYTNNDKTSPLKRSLRSSSLHHSLHNIQREKSDCENDINNNSNNNNVKIADDTFSNEVFISGLRYVNASTANLEPNNKRNIQNFVDHESIRRQRRNSSKNNSNTSDAIFSSKEAYLQKAPRLCSSVPDAY